MKKKTACIVRLKAVTVLIGIIFLLSGCLYPEKNLSENQIPYKDQIQAVQTAVDQFREDGGGILPIKTKDAETPIYHKYVIDFNKLTSKYMAEPPGNAYEMGGVFQYVLTDVEKNPTVKLFDIRISEAIQDLNTRLTIYRQNNGYPPYKEQLSKEVFTLDYKKLGLKEEPTVVSPFTGRELHFVIYTPDAQLYVDYTPDLMKALQDRGEGVKTGDDIRRLLVDRSEFVPVHSLSYTIDKQKKPVFMKN
ncbi:hypothetical protein D0469_12260 [Peribacillus saganii]|uniref:ABC transporter periplasmic binding protein yphF n=1 Tax=Peribacillus saganii TaxID=2303992 RepID=A0A372LNQ4_9BACI|nr:hypothetical protein [Peribacillus saganii]RFU68504.1 hypothetical protein D0469_12260 [Peribacillus saganii]